MEKKLVLPLHEMPQLHENGATISFENCYRLGKIYKEILGKNGIDHFSINVIDASEKMTILSYRPQIAYNIFKDGFYLYNGSISKTYYNQKDFYSWDETYDPRYYHVLKNNMERKNGINKGLVFVRRHLGLTLLYSFATKKTGQEFLLEAQEQSNLFYSMGDHCFALIKPIIEDRLIGNPSSTNLFSSKNVIRFPSREKL